MPKESWEALGAKGKTDLFLFDPEDIVLTTDKSDLLYDSRAEDGFDEAMVANILYAPDGKTPQGVIEPILFRRRPEDGRPECIDGRKRTLANREANRRLKKQGLPILRIPGLPKRADDSRLFAMMVSANAHRSDDSPSNRADKAVRFLNMGHDEREVAVLLGVSQGTVRNILALVDAPACIKKAVDAGKITASAGYKLAREEPAEAKEKLAKLLEQAPREPGKKRSKNARKARAIVGGGGAQNTRPVEGSAADRAAAHAPANRSLEPVAKFAGKVEDEVAAAIAAWIEATWNDAAWGGAPSEIPRRLRAGEWRQHRDANDPFR